MLKPQETWHQVQEDEDLPIIAAQYGIKDWKFVYNHDKNAELRKNRPSPYILYKGDKVWIPKVEPKQFEAVTDQTHKYVLYPPKVPFQLVLRDDDGEPYAGIKYEIRINNTVFGEGEKKTREDGLIFEMIPLVKEFELRVWFPTLKEEEAQDNDDIEVGEPEEGDDQDPWFVDDEEPLPEEEFEVKPEVYESFTIKLAHVDPLHTIEGLQDRLNSLGYRCGDEHGQIGPETEQAIREFQADYGLPETGQVDLNEGSEDEVLEALAKLFEEEGDDQAA
jgi:N-acetylmuramoyl-L-alanine amidase